VATPLNGVPLPERTGGKLRIAYPRLNEPINAISHSSKVHGTLMHWGERNSFPCIKHLAPCPCNGRKLKTLWYGWLIGVEQHKRGRVLIQLSEAAVKSSLVLSDGRIDLRGAKIKLERIPIKQGTLVRSSVTLEDWKDHTSQADPDVFELLLQFYKIEIRHWAAADQVEGGED